MISNDAASVTIADVQQKQHQRPTTITDIAKLCGVTAATVSRVLNQKAAFSTSAPVRQKIVDTAAQLGYAPDLAARSLNRRNTRIVGVFASPRTHIAAGINDPLLEGLASALHAAGYEVFFELSSADTTRPPLPFWRFDGAVLMQAPRPDTVVELDRRKVPYVCLNEQIGRPVVSVLADDASGTRLAIEHLHQLGHRRLAYANAHHTYFSHYSVGERHDTLVGEARRRGMTVVAGHDQPFADDGVAFLTRTVRGERATAVVTYDHQIAVQLVAAAAGLGLILPRDLSLICFNDVFPVAHLVPPLTAVAVSGKEMGRAGGEALLRTLERTRPAAGTQEIRIPEKLVVRKSTAPLPSS